MILQNIFLSHRNNFIMENKKELTIDWVVKKYLAFFSKYGMTEQKIISGYNNWSESGTTSIKEYVWYLFQLLLEKDLKQFNTKSELHRFLRDLYFEMLQFKRKNEKEKANDIFQLFLDLDIKQGMDSNFELSVSIVSGHCCDYCDSLNENTYQILDVWENKYLGSMNCTNPKGRNCTYIFRGFRDSNDRLIFK